MEENTQSPKLSTKRIFKIIGVIALVAMLIGLATYSLYVRNSNNRLANEKQALQEIVLEKAGVDIALHVPYVEQLYTFDTAARDPRGHAVSVTYMGCGREIPIQKTSDEACFFAVHDMPELAFDHRDIITYAHKRLSAKLTYTNAVHALLPQLFTLTQLQIAYEAVFGRSLDKRNFRKKFLSLGLIHETDQTWREGAHRPAKLYEFNSHTLESLSRSFD